MKKIKLFKNIGPGPLIAAAFIGPGTVTTCTSAGAGFGYQLLWALLLSIFATIVLQGMSARLGLVSRKGLSEATLELFSNPFIKYALVLLIVSAILLGNSAYQAGNILGGVLGLETLLPPLKLGVSGFSLDIYVLLISGVAFGLLYTGKYKSIERILVTLVIIMSLSFITAAIMTRPDLSKIIPGLFAFRQPEGSLLTVMGLIGTTVVPYNLFLHSSLVKEKWKSVSALGQVRRDTFIAITLGGIVSMAILIAATSIQGQEVKSAGDLAKGLSPVFGFYSDLFLGIGLFAAGITSAVTAPLAAAYVAKGCFGWSDDLKNPRFRAVWILVLVIGIIFAHVGKSPLEIIQFAQVANALLLPIIVVLLLFILNRSKLMGDYRNSLLQNVFGILILAVVVGLTVKTFMKIFGS